MINNEEFLCNLIRMSLFDEAVQVKLELGHRAQFRKKPTAEGFTHDWMVFVRGPENSNIQHFVEKVVFHLHESFPKPKRGRDPG
uniref:YEATS domain-containing protein n=1 Tax=Poecilia formosa TaxID=48698 RepID=A0A096MHG0_POEFO